MGPGHVVPLFRQTNHTDLHLLKYRPNSDTSSNHIQELRSEERQNGICVLLLLLFFKTLFI